MTVSLAAPGVRLDLPDGWDGRIRGASPAAGGAALRSDADDLQVDSTMVVHAATVPLMADAGDFGSGVVETLGANDVFFALIEFDPASASTPLFQRVRGMPRRLRPTDFNPQALQRTLPGQSGTQVFFNHGGRALCFYAVLGSHLMRVRSVPRLNAAVRGVALG